jgi:hypothetical protein
VPAHCLARVLGLLGAGAQLQRDVAVDVDRPLAVTWQPSSDSTVTGTCVPGASKNRVMPSFLASTPVRVMG